MPQQAIELCRQAADRNVSEPLRQGNVIVLPDEARVVLTGDLHGNRRNFERIVAYCDLENRPNTHVFLQEIIHGGPSDELGGCLSYQLLLEALEFQLRYPDQVHVLLGNHDTACITDSDVSKGGLEMNSCMQMAMQRRYDVRFDEVYESFKYLLRSLPLAARTPNRVWMSHSLPADRFLDVFDETIFTRRLEYEDYCRPHSVYYLTWGRRQSAEGVARMGRRLDVDLFVLGHQNQEMGWGRPNEQTLIIASDHAHGCLLDFECGRPYTLDELSVGIVPLASIG